jgi:Mg-chelatase subunit ChlD
MKKNLKQVLAYIITLTIILSSSWISRPVVQAKTFDFKAEVSTNREADKTSFMFDEEFVAGNEVMLNYSVEFDEIEKTKIEGQRKPKEIVLIIDTSGSMAWDLEGNNPSWNEDSRLDITQEAAKTFLNQLSELDDVKVSLINYSYEGNVYRRNGVNLFDLNNTNLNRLKNKIDDFDANGGTNIGDALRQTHYLLKENGNTDADQYVVLMTDGEPTFYSYENNGSYQTRSGSAINYNNGNHYTKGLEYANLIASSLVANTSTVNYGIAFSDLAAGNKLREIMTSMGGSYYQALTAEDINAVYEEIAQEISVEASLNEVVFEEELPSGIEVVELPDGFEVNNNVIQGTWSRVEYTLNESTGFYEAPTLNFQIKVRVTEAGEYLLSTSNAGIYYTDLDGTLGHKDFDEVRLLAEAFVEGEDSYLKLSRASDRTSFDLSSNPEENRLNLDYSITFKPFEATSLTDENPEREIILVFDTSGSMRNNIAGTWENGERLEVAQSSARRFIDKFSAYSNTKIGLVTFDSKADVDVELTSDKESVRSKISDLYPNGGTNTGDGLRLAYHALNNGSQADKHIVLMTDGEPNAFSISSDEYFDFGGNAGTFYEEEYHWLWGYHWNNWSVDDITSTPDFKLDNGDTSQYFTTNINSSNDYRNYGYTYAKELSEIIRNNNIKPHYIAFSSDANNNVLDSLANDANAQYYQAFSATDMENVYDQIASDITSTMALDNLQFEETLPANVKVISVTEGFEQNGQMISKEFGNIEYTLNTETNMYEAAPIEFSVEVEIEEPGNYVFGDDEASYVTYVDTEQNPRKLSFPELHIEAKELFNEPPIISTEFDEELVIVSGEESEGNEPAITVHAKFDGIKVDIVETAYKKLADDQETATANDFVGANASSNNPMVTDDDSPFEDDSEDEVVLLEKIEVTENGFYAIYAKNAVGLETVEVIEIDNFVLLPDVI